MRTISALILTVVVTGVMAMAQNAKSAPEGSAREEALERSVHLTSKPAISNLTASSATLTWTTNKAAATDVHYCWGGSHCQVAYEKGGSTSHSVTLSGLRPNKTYTYKIMTHEKEVRFTGTFHTPA